MKHILKRLKCLINELGWANASFYFIDRLLDRFSGSKIRLYKYYFVAQRVAQEPLSRSQLTENWKFKQIKANDPEIRYFPRPVSVIINRFEQGALCIALFKDGMFAGFIWLLLGSYLEDEVRCRFTPLPLGKAAWDFDVHIEPRYRFGRLFARIWDEANNLLRKKSIAWSMSRISAFNSGSLASHMRLGAFRLGTAFFLRCGKWQLMLCSLAPFFHFSSRPSQLPELCLRADKT